MEFDIANRVKHKTQLIDSTIIDLTSLYAKVQNGRYIITPRPLWKRCLEQILQKDQPQVAWFNYGHWGQYVPLVHRYGAKAVMRVSASCNDCRGPDSARQRHALQNLGSIMPVVSTTLGAQGVKK